MAQYLLERTLVLHPFGSHKDPAVSKGYVPGNPAAQFHEDFAGLLIHSGKEEGMDKSEQKNLY